jgi:hypothetical protein
MRTFAVLIAAAAAYGFSLGAAHDLVYATRNLVKLPLLLLTTAVICAPGYWVVARSLGAPLRFVGTQTLSLRLFRDLALLLASLVPANGFIAAVLAASDDGRLGEYDLFLGLNVLFVATCGTLALVRQGRELLVATCIPRRRAVTVILAWLLLSLGVGGQAAFVMRPLFGLPASRGQMPPWFLGTTPDVRGATNFYEMVLQVMRRPGLPDRWR